MKIHELKKDEVSKQFMVFRKSNFVICTSQVVSLRNEAKEVTYVAEAKILHSIFVENSIENHPLGDSSRGNESSYSFNYM
jgi:hypothetical protein